MSDNTEFSRFEELLKKLVRTGKSTYAPDPKPVKKPKKGKK